MMMKIEKEHMGDESGGEPESRLYYPLKSRRHISIILRSIRIFAVANSQKLRAKSRFSVSRRQLPQTRYHLGHERQSVVYILRGRLLAQAETQAGTRLIWAQTHG